MLTLKPFPKLVAQISLGLKGLKSTRTGCMNGYSATRVKYGSGAFRFRVSQSPSPPVFSR